MEHTALVEAIAVSRPSSLISLKNLIPAGETHMDLGLVTGRTWDMHL